MRIREFIDVAENSLKRGYLPKKDTDKKPAIEKKVDDFITWSLNYAKQNNLIKDIPPHNIIKQKIRKAFEDNRDNIGYLLHGLAITSNVSGLIRKIAGIIGLDDEQTKHAMVIASEYQKQLSEKERNLVRFKWDEWELI